MKTWAMGIKNFVLDLIFPIFCVGCRQEGGFLCEKCLNSLYFIPPTCLVCRKWSPAVSDVVAGRTCKSCQSKTAVYAFLSPFAYNDPKIRELIHDFKYRGIRSVDKTLARLLVDYFIKYKIIFPPNSIVMPLPLHKSRQRERGFNQSELLSRKMSDRLGLTLETKILWKTQKTRQQMELSGEERMQNISGVFAVKNPEKIQNKTVLLVDDVKTTGSTLEEAAKTLKIAGAKRVWAITVAH